MIAARADFADCVEESEAGWRKIWCIPVFPEKPLLRKWGRKLFFMALIAIAPEVVVALAARQHLEARNDLRDVKLCSENMRKYTMAHAMFAQMGGFVVHYHDDPTTQEAETDHAQTPVVKEAIDTRSEALRKAMQNGDGKPSRAQSLSLSQVEFQAKLEEYGIAFNLEEEDIKDRSKADPFTKAFALVQAGWLVLQSCARKSAGLQITELELMTMAFTVCALVTYILWWHKPFDAERSAIVSLPASRCEAIYEVLRLPDTPISFARFRRRQHKVDLDSDSFLSMVVDVGEERGRMTPEFISSVALYVFGAIFSAIHFAAWNWDFPLPIVQTLWRSFCCAALGSATLPLVTVFLILSTPDGLWGG
ncbi:hypothetical protein E8E14_006062 [Neopestalotiopsis sp. 37M]|nr:hypothetical protein E8E14_006062 [Neopestalotiopsis sp. 37M]